MKFHRFDPGAEIFLFEVPWETDREYRMHPGVMTALLREQVPVLDYVQWEVKTIEPASAVTVLPLNPQSTNQHFTHQAALLLLAADYTGGLALSSLIHGWPIVGVHPVSSSRSISLWLVKAEIKYLRPSIGDLTVSAEVEPDKRERIQRRFADGKVVLESIAIRFRNGEVDVAEATCMYFARQSERLRCEGIDPGKMHLLHQLKLTSSAELIAGVRARESGKLFQDPFAARMAGQHGMALATRFCEKMPQLAGMVAARTRHLDREIQAFCARGGREVVLLGVGWDMRAFRLPLPAGTKVYELDYPSTLVERRQRIADLKMTESPGVERIEIPIDLRTMPLAATLDGAVNRRAPVFVACEGMSMYFEEPEFRAVLQGIAPLLQHPDSCLWVDLVDREAVVAPENCAGEVQAFMYGMQLLGEPFVFGPASVEAFMADNGFRCREVAVSDLFFEDRNDPVYALYRFCVASSAVAAPTAVSPPVLTLRPGVELAVPAKPHQPAPGEVHAPLAGPAAEPELGFLRKPR
jgi:methyltransferase (TIGR00027 family)